MKKILIVLLCFGLMLALPACKQEDPPAEGQYQLYYLNMTGTELVAMPYVPAESETKALAEELFRMLKTGAPEDAASSVSGQLELNYTELSGVVLELYLTGSFSNTDAGFLLSLAAMTRTLTQIEGVRALSVNLNGKPLTDRAGKEIGLMERARFVDNGGDSPDDYKEETLVLYFADETGTELRKTTKTLICSNSASIQRVIVEQLIAGPDSAEFGATLPKTAKLLGVSLRDGICYVNFDTKFITDFVAGDDAIALYSVVNSLAELDSVEQVQFIINGSTAVNSPLGQFSLETPFSPNYDLVK